MVGMGTPTPGTRLQQRPPLSMLAIMLRVIPHMLCLGRQVLVAQGAEPQFQAISCPRESSTIQHYQVTTSERSRCHFKIQGDEYSSVRGDDFQNKDKTISADFMMHVGGVEVKLLAFLILALAEGE